MAVGIDEPRRHRSTGQRYCAGCRPNPRSDLAVRAQGDDFACPHSKSTDVRIGGISLVANYRTEFDNLIRESDIEGLIKALRAKNGSLDQPAVTGTQKK